MATVAAAHRQARSTLLALYGLYKQGSVGDNLEKKPGFSDIVARAKWEAWSKLLGTAPEAAMQRYIDRIAELE